MTIDELAKIKDRAKEGGHYTKWLFVNELIEEVERLQSIIKGMH